MDLNELNAYIIDMIHEMEFFWTVFLGLAVALIGWVFAQKTPMTTYRAVVLTIGLVVFFCVNFFGLYEHMARASHAVNARTALIASDGFAEEHLGETTPEDVARFYDFLASEEIGLLDSAATYTAYWLFAGLDEFFYMSLLPLKYLT